MGTEYKLLEREVGPDNDQKEITVYEMSNKFTMYAEVVTRRSPEPDIIRLMTNLSDKDLYNMGLKLIQTASYFTDLSDNTFKNNLLEDLRKLL